MTDDQAHLDAALESVINAARAHLAAVKAADGRVDDDGVWKAYVELNNASYAYDDALLEAYGEVTPWDVDAIDPDLADEKIGEMADLVAAEDPYPQVISVRQRRDYRVPSVTALFKAAQSARFDAMNGDEGADDRQGDLVLDRENIVEIAVVGYILVKAMARIRRRLLIWHQEANAPSTA